jgi:hypothetical protein
MGNERVQVSARRERKKRLTTKGTNVLRDFCSCRFLHNKSARCEWKNIMSTVIIRWRSGVLPRTWLPGYRLSLLLGHVLGHAIAQQRRRHLERVREDCQRASDLDICICCSSRLRIVHVDAVDRSWFVPGTVEHARRSIANARRVLC